MSTILRWLAAAIITGGLAYLLVTVLAWRFQDRLAFPGPKSTLPPPDTQGAPDGTMATVTTEDGVTLRGWYLPPNPAPEPRNRAPAVIWFYGNMETVAWIAPILLRFRPPRMALLALDYRGYGSSGGKATEKGVYLDAEAAWDYLTQVPEIDSTRIAVYGRSIGSVVALYLATERPVRAVVLDSPLTNAREMAKRHYRFLPTRIARLSLNNLARAKKLDVPLIVFHGSNDWIVPIDMGRRVAEAGRAEAFVEITGAGHNNIQTVGGDAYVARFHEFLETHLR